MAEAVEDAFRYGRLVLATTTYNADIFPFMRTFIEHLTERNYQNRLVGFVENGSWAPTAAKVMRGLFEKSKGLSFCANTVTITSALNAASEAQPEKSFRLLYKIYHVSMNGKMSAGLGRCGRANPRRNVSVCRTTRELLY